MVSGFETLYRVHFPSGSVERIGLSGPPKQRGEVIELGRREFWRVENIREVEEASDVEYELEVVKATQ